MPLFFKPFAVWFLLGALGLIALAVTQDIATLRQLGVPPEMSDIAVRALIVVQPAILLVAGIAAGVGLGAQIGLRSWLTDRVRGDTPVRMGLASLGLAIVAGYVAGGLVVVIDLAVFSGIDAAQVANVPGPKAALAALLYGGITEELMLRYGLMVLIVWLLARILPSRPRAIFIAAILLAAVLFGAGHLPAMAALTPLTGMVILRTIGLNALLGLVYGWLFWRRRLEHAMLAHMATHLSFWTAGALL